MKRNILLLLLLMLVFTSSIYSQKAALIISNNKVKIIGFVKNIPPYSKAKISFYDIKLNKNIVEDSSVLDTSGHFQLNVSVLQFKEAELTIAEQYTELFLEQNDSLVVEVDYKNFDSTINYKGAGAGNNNYKAKEFFKNFEERAHQYNRITQPELFRKFIDSLQTDEFDFIRKNSSSNLSTEFVKQISLNAKYRYVYVLGLLEYEFNLKTQSFSKKILPNNYFNYFESVDINDESALSNSNYRLAVENYVSHFSPLKDTSFTNKIGDNNQARKAIWYGYLKEKLKGKVREFFLTEFLKNDLTEMVNDKMFVDSLVNDFLKINTQPMNEIEIKLAIEKLFKLKKGEVAPDFSLLDSNNKIVSLNSLKGKVIYIDFWATWCVPCMAEMPHSKRISEEFKDKNIAFVYICVNDDFKKWQQKIKTYDTNSINLFANEIQSQKLRDEYNFYGIPHYVLIDANGKIIDSDAVRPSGKARDLINEYVK